MKSLITAASAIALTIDLTSIAATQETVTMFTDEGQVTTHSEPKGAKTAVSPPYESRTLPVAEAKKRYLATHVRLQNLVKGASPQSLEVEVRRHGNDAEIAFHEARDRLRAAVAEDFEARRQLQQAELAELENRIVRIKRAMEIRDAMRDTLIDQRTDELLDQLEEGGKRGQSDAAAAPNGGRPANHGVSDLIRRSTPKEAARILKRQLDQAKADFESAKRSYERAQRAFQSGAISEEVRSEEEQKQRTAKIALDRLLLEWAAFVESHGSDLPAAKEPAPGDGAVADQPLAERLTQLDLKEAVVLAEANLAAAKNLYDYSKKMHAKGYVTAGDVESKASQMERARFQLERANLKLDAFLEAHPDLPAAKDPPASDGAVNEPTKTADQAAIAGAPVDDGSPIDLHATLAALEADVAEAKAKRESAERDYWRFEKMRVGGEIEQALLDEKTEECKQAQIQLERKELIRNRFVLTHPSVATGKPPADGDVGVSNFNQQLAALAVQEAESNLAEQEIRYERYQRLAAESAIERRLLDEQADKHKHAQIQLERAKAKLKALNRPTGDEPANDRTKTSSDHALIN